MRLYVADYGLGGVHKLAGCRAGTFFADMSGPGSIAFPPSGSPYGDHLYACEAFDGPIYQISPTGVLTEWLALQTVYLRFGPGGAWGTGLFATDPTFGEICRVRSNGTKTLLAKLGGAADVAYRPGEGALHVVSNQGGAVPHPARRVELQGQVLRAQVSIVR